MRKNVVILFLVLIGLVATTTAEAQRRRVYRSRRVVTRRWAPRPVFRSYNARPSVSIGYRSGFYRSPFYGPRSFYGPRYGGWGGYGGWGPGGGVFIGGRRFSIGIGF